MFLMVGKVSTKIFHGGKLLISATSFVTFIIE